MNKIKSKNKKIYLLIGIISLIISIAFVISVRNLKNTSPIVKDYPSIVIDDKSETVLETVISDTAHNVVEVTSKNDNFFSNSIDTELNKQKYASREEIKITTGLDSMDNEHMRFCYESIKNASQIISPRKNAAGMFDVKAISLKGVKMSSEAINKIILAVYNDNPEIFWLNDNYTILTSNNGTILKLSSFLSPAEIFESKAKLDKKIEEIVKNAPKNVSDYDLELYVHDYIIDNCSYDKSETGRFSNFKYSSYGCLVEGKAVCSGMSRANQLLLNKLGIECRVITGDSRKEPHMWNIVKIDENWYHQDVTWDNTSNGLNRYYYFNVNDKIIEEEHKKNLPYPENVLDLKKNERYNFSMPKCDRLDENFFTKNALKITNLNWPNNDLISELSKKSMNHEKYIYLQVDPNLNFDTAVNRMLLKSPYILTQTADICNKKLPSGKRILRNKIFYSKFIPLKAISVELNYG